MKKKDFEKKILDIVERYKHILLLENHTWEVRYGTEHENSYFEFKFNYPYLSAIILYSDSGMKMKNIEPAIVHEMCHAITDPLYAKSCSRYISERDLLDERERLTDHIANIVYLNQS